MRRKDILIIVAILIVITFGTVFAIYYAINGDNIFSKATEEIAEKVEEKKEYHSNGWETAIVDEIKYDAPIPVGFTYIEGKKETGIIIKNIETEEKYMWIPAGEIDVEEYQDVLLNQELGQATEENKESIEKYNGFYVAIDDRTDEEKFEEFLKENAQDFETYREVKELGYERYKNRYKETTGEEFVLNSLDNITIDEKTKLDNETKTNILEIHTLTAEELASVKEYEEQIGSKISVKNYKTLTLGKRYVNTNNKKYELVDNEEKIEYAIKYAAIVNDKTEKEIKKEIGYSTGVDYNSDEDEYEEIRRELIAQVHSKESTYSKMCIILDEGYIYKKDLEEIDEDDDDGKEIDEENWNKNIIEKVVDGVPIPKGFTYDENQTVETGFKITDTDNLAFIWIPVEDVNKVTEKFIEKAREAGLDEDLEIEEYEKYSDTEDDIYNELKDSINTYGGFYISEAELGYDKNGYVVNTYRPMIGDRVSNGDYFRNEYVYENSDSTVEGAFDGKFELSYEEAEKKCEELYKDSLTVKSHLTYGLEYDATVLYLLENCSKVNLELMFNDSTTIGKYVDSEKETLWKTKYELNGIFGLGGNLAEITAEKDGENAIVRGGRWSVSGKTEQLAGKTPMNDEDFKNDKDTIGFRACIYIKTGYDEEVAKELENDKDAAKRKLEEYINEKDVANFNNTYNNQTDEYETEILNQIIEYINGRIDKETSSTSFNKIIQYGKDQVDSLVSNIVAMKEYRTGEGETYGTAEIEINGVKTTVNDACWQIKEKAINTMHELLWDNGVLEPKSYADIRQEAEKEIEDIRKEYKTAVINLFDCYRVGENKEYITKIKEYAKNNEFKWTEDLANLDNIRIKYEGIIEIAYNFDNDNPSSKEYYDSWKDEKEQYLNEIAKTTTKEDAQAKADEGNNKIADIIKQKKAEQETETIPKEVIRDDCKVGVTIKLNGTFTYYDGEQSAVEIKDNGDGTTSVTGKKAATVRLISKDKLTICKILVEELAETANDKIKKKVAEKGLTAYEKSGKLYIDYAGKTFVNMDGTNKFISTTTYSVNPFLYARTYASDLIKGVSRLPNETELNWIRNNGGKYGIVYNPKKSEEWVLFKENYNSDPKPLWEYRYKSGTCEWATWNGAGTNVMAGAGVKHDYRIVLAF